MFKDPQKEKEYRRNYYRKNKEKLNKRAKQWLIDHPGKEAEYGKKYRETHSEQVSQRAKARRNGEQREKILQQTKDSRQSSPRNFLVVQLNKRLANTKRGKSNPRKVLEYNINIDYLIEIWESQQGKCAITGYTMLHEFKNPYTVSIDRIDSSQGYIKGNIQLVCQSINFAKNSWSNDQIKEFWNNRPTAA